MLELKWLWQLFFSDFVSQFFGDIVINFLEYMSNIH